MESAHSAQPLTVGNLPEKLPQPGQVHFSIIVRGWGGAVKSQPSENRDEEPGDGPIGKVLTARVCEPKFNPQLPHKEPMEVCT